jgi:hypothetical protein
MYRTTVWYFALLLLFAVGAFWPSYLAAPPFKRDFYHVHFHGLVMFAWFALLVSQAMLMRMGNRTAHRAIGRASYVLVPLIVVSTLLLSHLRAHETPAAEEVIYFLYVQLALIVFLVLCYGWAMLHRREPMLHGRYMAGTALAAVDPIFARLLYNHLGIEPPLLQVLTYGLVLAVLGALYLRERKKPAYARAWRIMLVTYAVLVLPTFLVTQTAAWRSFVAWYGSLPLP